jgi:hypothetical protein
MGAALLAEGAVSAAEAPASSEHHWFVAQQGPASWRLLARMDDAVEYSEMRIQEGDDSHWAERDFDDRGWRVGATGAPAFLPTRAGIFWVRRHVRWKRPEGRIPEGVHLLFLLGSYDVYWDGVLIGRNGIPGNSRAEEVEGRNACHPSIPLALTGPGEHVLALRISTYHATIPGKYTSLLMLLMTPESFDSSFRRDNIAPTMASGALFTIAIAALVMWLIAAHRRGLLMFAGLCLCGGLMELLRWYSLGYVYPVSWGFALELAIAATGLGLSLCFVAVMIDQWCVPRGRWWLAALLVVAAGLTARDYSERLYYLAPEFIGASFIFVGAGCVWAARRRRPNVWVIAAAVATSGTLLWNDPSHFVGLDFHVRFLPIVLGVLVTIALQLRTERRQAQETKLTAARLEIELLKKSLQPHFLMNTLTALAQTIEENPRVAVKLIDDLAVEFRALARFAGKPQIPLGQEVELCRAHLRVMSVRTEQPWSLSCEGVDPAQPVPPALFLTLIENGFSHQQPGDGATVFSLRTAPFAEGTRYTFLSPGAVRASAAAANGGTGLRYIKARLEEGWPGNWSFAQRAVPEGWETIIELRSRHERRGP